jgi:MoaA/NifB/PqqE/SkfB family radical SAM enzyme
LSEILQKTVYCTAPFKGLTIREDGHVRTCCAGKTSLGNLNEMSIGEIERSPILKQIQQQMLTNSSHSENCQNCVENEKKNGLATLRQYYLKFYPNIDPSQLELNFLDVRWNNTCNLGCLYCNPTFSSIWVDRLHREKKILPVKTYQDELLDWILKQIHNLNEIMLVGGEPMLMKQNYALLSKLPENCKISIITNLSYDLENLPCWNDLLKRPPELICWNVSIENTREKFEYVRSGSNWRQVQENFELLKKHWPMNVSLNMVYNLFSAFDLPETVEYFHKIGVKKFNLFPVEHNFQIELSNFPQDIRALASKKLKQAQQIHLDSIPAEDHDLYSFQGLDAILNSILENNPTKTITLEEFDKKIQWYDQWGRTRFADLWPDLNDLVQNHLKTCKSSA